MLVRMRRIRILVHCSWDSKMVWLLWKTIQWFLRKLIIKLPYMIQQSHIWVFIQNN